MWSVPTISDEDVTKNYDAVVKKLEEAAKKLTDINPFHPITDLWELPYLTNLTLDFSTVNADGFRYVGIVKSIAGSVNYMRINLTSWCQVGLKYCDRLLKVHRFEDWLTMSGHLDLKLITETQDMFYTCCRIIQQPHDSTKPYSGFMKYSTEMALHATLRGIHIFTAKWINAYIDWVNMTVRGLQNTDGRSSRKSTIPVTEILHMLTVFYLLFNKLKTMYIPDNVVVYEEQEKINLVSNAIDALFQNSSNLLPYDEKNKMMLFQSGLPVDYMDSFTFSTRLSTNEFLPLVKAEQEKFMKRNIGRQKFRAIHDLAMLKVNFEGPSFGLQADMESTFDISFQSSLFAKALEGSSTISDPNADKLIIPLNKDYCARKVKEWATAYENVGKYDFLEETQSSPKIFNVLKCFTDVTKVCFTVDVISHVTGQEFFSQEEDGEIWRCKVTAWPLEFFQNTSNSKLSWVLNGVREWKEEAGNPYYQITLSCRYDNLGTGELVYQILDHTQFYEVTKHDSIPKDLMSGIEANPDYVPDDIVYNDSYSNFESDPTSSHTSLPIINRYRLGYTHGVDLFLSYLKFQTNNRIVNLNKEFFHVKLFGYLKKFKAPQITYPGEISSYLSGKLPQIHQNYNIPPLMDHQYDFSYHTKAIRSVQEYSEFYLGSNFIHIEGGFKHHLRFTLPNNEGITRANLLEDHGLMIMFLQNVYQILLEEQHWRLTPFIFDNLEGSNQGVSLNFFQDFKNKVLSSIIPTNTTSTTVNTSGLDEVVTSLDKLSWKTSDYGKISPDEEILISQRSESLAQSAVYGHLEKMLNYSDMLFTPDLIEKFKMHRPAIPKFDDIELEVLCTIYRIFRGVLDKGGVPEGNMLENCLKTWYNTQKSQGIRLEAMWTTLFLKYHRLFARISKNASTSIDSVHDTYYPKEQRRVQRASHIYDLVYDKMVHIFLKLRSMNFRKACFNKKDSFIRFRFLTSTFNEMLKRKRRESVTERMVVEGEDEEDQIEELVRYLNLEYGGDDDYEDRTALGSKGGGIFRKKLDSFLKMVPEVQPLDIARVKPHTDLTLMGDIEDMSELILSICILQFKNSPNGFIANNETQLMEDFISLLENRKVEREGYNSHPNHLVTITISDNVRIKPMGSCLELLEYSFKSKWGWMQPAFEEFIRKDVLPYENLKNPLIAPQANSKERNTLNQSLKNRIDTHCFKELAACFACLKPLGPKLKEVLDGKGNSSPQQYKSLEELESQENADERDEKLKLEMRRLMVGLASPIDNSKLPILVKKIPQFSKRMELFKSFIGKADGIQSQILEPDVYHIDTGLPIGYEGEQEQEEEEEVVVAEGLGGARKEHTLGSTTPSLSKMDVESGDEHSSYYSDEDLDSDIKGLLAEDGSKDQETERYGSFEDKIDRTHTLRESYNLELQKSFKTYFDREKNLIMSEIIEIILIENGQGHIVEDKQTFQNILQEETELMTNLFLKEESFSDPNSSNESWVFLRRFVQWMKAYFMSEYRYGILEAFSTRILNHVILYPSQAKADADAMALALAKANPKTRANAKAKAKAKAEVQTEDKMDVIEISDDTNDDDGDGDLELLEGDKEALEHEPTTAATAATLKESYDPKASNSTSGKVSPQKRRDFTKNYEELLVLMRTFFGDEKKSKYVVKSAFKIRKILESVKAYEYEYALDKVRNTYLSLYLKSEIGNPSNLGDTVIEGLKILFSKPVGGSWFHNALYAGLSNIPAKDVKATFSPWTIHQRGPDDNPTQFSAQVWDFLSDNAYGRYLLGPQRLWDLSEGARKNPIFSKGDETHYYSGVENFFDFDLFQRNMDENMEGFGKTPESKMARSQNTLVYLKNVQQAFFQILEDYMSLIENKSADGQDLIPTLWNTLKGWNKDNTSHGNYFQLNMDYFKKAVEKVGNLVDLEDSELADVSNIFRGTVILDSQNSSQQKLQPLEWLFVTMWLHSCNLFLEDKKDDIVKGTIKYEQLVGDPSTCFKMLHFLPVFEFSKKVPSYVKYAKKRILDRPISLIDMSVLDTKSPEYEDYYDEDEYEGEYEENEAEGIYTSSTSVGSHMSFIGGRTKKDSTKSDTINTQPQQDAGIQKKRTTREGEKVRESGKKNLLVIDGAEVSVQINRTSKKTGGGRGKGRGGSFNVANALETITKRVEEDMEKFKTSSYMTGRKIINYLACTANLLILGSFMIRDFYDHGSLLARYNVDTMAQKWTIGERKANLPTTLAGLTIFTNNHVKKRGEALEVQKIKAQEKELEKRRKQRLKEDVIGRSGGGKERARGSGDGRGGKTGVTDKPNLSREKEISQLNLKSTRDNKVKTHKSLTFIRQSRQEGVNLQKFWPLRSQLLGQPHTYTKDTKDRKAEYTIFPLYVDKDSNKLDRLEDVQKLSWVEKKDLFLYNLTQVTRLYPRYIHYSKKGKKTSTPTTISEKCSSLVRQTFAFEDGVDDSKSGGGGNDDDDDDNDDTSNDNSKKSPKGYFAWTPQFRSYMPYHKEIYPLGSYNVDACFSIYPYLSNSTLYYNNPEFMKVDQNTLLPKPLRVATRTISISDHLSKYAPSGKFSSADDLSSLQKKMVKYYSSLDVLSVVTVGKYELEALLKLQSIDSIEDLIRLKFPLRMHDGTHQSEARNNGVILLGVTPIYSLLSSTSTKEEKYKVFYSVASNPNPIFSDEGYGFQKFWNDVPTWMNIYKDLSSGNQGSKSRTFQHNLGLTWDDDYMKKLDRMYLDAQTSLREGASQEIREWVQMNLTKCLILERIAEEATRAGEGESRGDSLDSLLFHKGKPLTYLPTLGLKLVEVKRKEESEYQPNRTSRKAQENVGMNIPNRGCVYTFTEEESVLKYLIDTHVKWIFLNASASGGSPSLSFNEGKSGVVYRDFQGFDSNLHGHSIISSFECRTKSLGAIAPYNISPIYLPQVNDGVESQLASSLRFYDSTKVPAPLCEPHHTPIDLLHILVALLDLGLTNLHLRRYMKEEKDTLVEGNLEKLLALRRMLAYLYNKFALSQNWCNVLSGGIVVKEYSKNQHQSAQTDLCQYYEWKIKEYDFSTKTFKTIEISLPVNYISDKNCMVKDLEFKHTISNDNRGGSKKSIISGIPGVNLPSKSEKKSTMLTHATIRKGENSSESVLERNGLIRKKDKDNLNDYDHNEVGFIVDDGVDDDGEEFEQDKPLVWMKYLDPQWKGVVSAPIESGTNDGNISHIKEEDTPAGTFPIVDIDENRVPKPTPTRPSSLPEYPDFGTTRYTHKDQFLKTDGTILVDIRSHKENLNEPSLSPDLIKDGLVIPSLYSKKGKGGSSNWLVSDEANQAEQKKTNLGTLSNILGGLGVGNAEDAIIQSKRQKSKNTFDDTTSELGKAKRNFDYDDFLHMMQSKEFKDISEKNSRTSSGGARDAHLSKLYSMLSQYLHIESRVMKKSHKQEKLRAKRQEILRLLGKEQVEIDLINELKGLEGVLEKEEDNLKTLKSKIGEILKGLRNKEVVFDLVNALRGLGEVLEEEDIQNLLEQTKNILSDARNKTSDTKRLDGILKAYVAQKESKIKKFKKTMSELSERKDQIQTEFIFLLNSSKGDSHTPGAKVSGVVDIATDYERPDLQYATERTTIVLDDYDGESPVFRGLSRSSKQEIARLKGGTNTNNLNKLFKLYSGEVIQFYAKFPLRQLAARDLRMDAHRKSDDRKESWELQSVELMSS